MNLAGLTEDELRELRYEVEEEEWLRNEFIGPVLPRDYDLVPMSDLELALHNIYKPALREQLTQHIQMLSWIPSS